MSLKLHQIHQKSHNHQVDSEHFSDLDHSITKRILIAEKYPYLKPLHVDVIIPNENGSKIKKFLVVNIGAGSRFIYNPPVVTDEEIKALRNRLVKYYQKHCHEQMDPVQQQDVKDMTIEELLRILITDEKPSYCFTADTYSKLQTPLNPVTRSPFSLRNLTFAALNRLVFNGLYGVAGVPGILTEIITPPQVPPVDGELIYRTQGNYMIVDVKIGEFVINLLEIMTNELDKVKEYTEKLWKRGFFQTFWSTNYQLVTGKQSIAIPPYDTILQNASLSLPNGENAVLYLKRLVE